MAETKKQEPDANRDPLSGEPGSVEDAYWREHYASRPYVTPGAPYEAYRPAYRYGWEARGRYGELNWQAAEPHLRQEWIHYRNESSLDWDKASPATRDAWERIRPGVRYTEENR